MVITEQDFALYVPVASSPEGYGVFNMVQDSIEVGKGVAASFLQPELSELLDETDGDNHQELLHLCNLVKRFICLYAFERAMPSLDLVLTNTGFGVVSNSNVAPASFDRVERLRKQIRRDKDTTLDMILENLRGVECWQDTACAKMFFSSLVWAGSQLDWMGYPEGGREKLRELKPRIEEAERQLKHLISPEQHKELTAAIRHRDTNSYQDLAIKKCLQYIEAYLSSQPSSILSAKSSLLDYLEKNLEQFQEYRQSSAWRANNYTPYQNQKNDTCFFFG